jgi:hypothetical protein
VTESNRFSTSNVLISSATGICRRLSLTRRERRPTFAAPFFDNLFRPPLCVPRGKSFFTFSHPLPALRDFLHFPCFLRGNLRSLATGPLQGGLGGAVSAEIHPTISSPIEGEGKNGNSRERLPRL